LLQDAVAVAIHFSPLYDSLSTVEFSLLYLAIVVDIELGVGEPSFLTHSYQCRRGGESLASCPRWSGDGWLARGT
jgi:hypothetical protein